VRTGEDVIRSLKRYIAHALGEEWEVRLWDEEGTFHRPFARVAKVGAKLMTGPVVHYDNVQPCAIHAYPVEQPSVEEAIINAERVEALLETAFRVGIAYDDPLMPPPSVICVGFAEGGELAADTYVYKLSAVNASGESLPQGEVSAVVTGTTSRIELAWTPAAGATSYRIYRGATPITTTLLAEVIGTTYEDLGDVVPGVTEPPETTSATATIRSAPMRVPLYDYEDVPVKGTGATSDRREVHDYIRVIDLSINKLHDPVDDRLVTLVCDARVGWRQRGRVPSGTKVLKSVKNTTTTS